MKGLLIGVMTLLAPRTGKFLRYWYRIAFDQCGGLSSKQQETLQGRLFVMCRYYEASRNILLVFLIAIVLSYLWRITSPL